MRNVRIQPGARFNVLLTEDRPHTSEHWTSQLPRLLEPQGVAAYVARSGQEAISLAEQLVLHAAVIDMATPYAEAGKPVPPAMAGRTPATPDEPAGLWLLELLRRLPNRPPVVVVHNSAYSQRQVDRLLREALRMGVFSVLNKPVQLEQLLQVFQRVLDRQYRGAWPAGHRPTDS